MIRDPARHWNRPRRLPPRIRRGWAVGGSCAWVLALLGGGFVLAASAKNAGVQAHGTAKLVSFAATGDDWEEKASCAALKAASALQDEGGFDASIERTDTSLELSEGDRSCTFSKSGDSVKASTACVFAVGGGSARSLVTCAKVTGRDHDGRLELDARSCKGTILGCRVDARLAISLGTP